MPRGTSISTYQQTTNDPGHHRLYAAWYFNFNLPTDNERPRTPPAFMPCGTSISTYQQTTSDPGYHRLYTAWLLQFQPTNRQRMTPDTTGFMPRGTSISTYERTTREGRRKGSLALREADARFGSSHSENSGCFDTTGFMPRGTRS